MQVVVAGAGIIGCSTGLYLARRGIKVCIVDPDPTRGATRPSWAWLNASKKSPEHYRRLNMDGMAEWAASFPHLVHAKSSVLLDDARPSTDPDYPCEALSCHQLCEAEPALNSKALEGRSIHRYTQEAWVDPHKACASMLEEARSLGAEVLLGESISSLVKTSDVSSGGERVTGVRTTSGTDFDADVVVLACGTGVPVLAGQLGLQVPLLRKPARVAYTSTLPPGTLSCMLCSPRVFLVQRPDGTFQLGQAYESEEEDASACMGEALMRDAVQLLPALATTRIEGVQVAFRPYPQDGHPVVGFAGEGLYMATTHSGMTLGPLMGRLVAQEVASRGQELAPQLAPYRPQRTFGSNAAYGGAERDDHGLTPF
ncbi:hypothetical protein FOA52_016032 [Chlamydomonas sp. UWO 241]|nr:hypothetical protein FOA52_016032 [Chlamydomonas sp. UWO 241]